MHFELKSISEQSIPEALAKVERYRLLNEPPCRKHLPRRSGHRARSPAGADFAAARAHRSIPLQRAAKAAQEVLAQIKGDYEQAYYAGIIWERLGNARIRHGGTGAGASAYHALRDAMSHYETAMTFAPPGNDEAILRWNTCARMIMQNPDIQPSLRTIPHRRGSATKPVPESQTLSTRW